MAASGPHVLRRVNLARVLVEVHRDGAVLRSELSARTGLRRSTMGELLVALAERGLVVQEQGTSDGEPGRPSNLVRARWGGAVAIAVEVGVRSLTAAAVGLGGDLRHRHHRTRDAHRLDVGATLEEIAAAVHTVLAQLQPDDHVVGVGISFFGVVDHRLGLVRAAPNLGWRDVPLEQLARQQLPQLEHRPLLLTNDADCGAIAEHRRGAGRTSDTLIYLAGEVGIGGGLILDGELFRGDGFAGELGHMVIDPAGDRCRCGRRGCLETEVGMAAVLARAGLPSTGGIEDAADRLRAAIDAGDRTAVAALDRAVHRLGLGLGNLANLLSPGCIVLGGWLGALHGIAGARIDAEVAGEVMAPMRERLRITPGELPDASLIGAGEQVLAVVLDDPLGTAAPAASA